MRTSRPLAGLTALLCSMALAFTGTVGAQAAATIPVHDLTSEIAPGEYSGFRLSTKTNITPEQIEDVDGFDVTDRYAPQPTATGTFWIPRGEGAMLTIRHLGRYTPRGGEAQWVNVRLTVTRDTQGCFNLTRYGTLLWWASNGTTNRFGFTIDLLDDQGRPIDGIKGVTGFTDLDGPKSASTPARPEGMELLAGFDAAYVRSDAHLTEYGTNGWAGAVDNNTNDNDMTNPHAMKHYLGATFTGPHLEVRFTTNGGSYGGNFFPVDVASEWPLTYELNGGTGIVPNEEGD